MAGLTITSNFQMTSSQLSFGNGNGIVLIGKSTSAVALKRAAVLDDAKTDLGESSNVAKMVEATMLQKAKNVNYIGLGASPAANAYKNALISGAGADGVYFYVVDDTSTATIAEIKDFIAWCNTNGVKAVVLAGGDSTVVTNADHYRIWVVDDNLADNAGVAVPAFVAAAAVAGALSNEPDLSVPFGGVVINGYTIKTTKHADTLRTQTEAGLMSFQKVGTEVQIFQGTTSYVPTAGAKDAALKDPEVVCTVDEVITSVENTLLNKFKRTKMSRLGDIADTTYMALDEKAKQEKIYPPDPERILTQPVPEVRGKGRLGYHFKVVPGLKELEVAVTGEVTAQNVS